MLRRNNIACALASSRLMALVAALATRKLWWAYSLTTVTTLSNMALVVLLYMTVAQAGSWVLPWRAWMDQVGLLIALALLVIALANLVLLVGVFRRFWRQSLADAPEALPAPAVPLPVELARSSPARPCNAGPER